MNIKKYFTNPYYVILIALICSLLWGSAFPVLKITYTELGLVPQDMYGKIVLAGTRFFLASILLFFLVSFGLKQSLKVNKQNLLELILLGILQTTLQYFFFYNGLAHTSGMKAAILNSIGIFFVVILAHFIYQNDKINWRKIIGLITGFSGIFLVNWGKDFTLDFSFQGEGFLILAGLTGALGTILAKRLSTKINPFLVTGWQMFIGSILLIGFGLSGLAPGTLRFTTKAWILLIYSSFLSAVAFSLWYSLLKYNKAGEISLYKFMIPVAGSILSVIFIPTDHFTLSKVAALVLVVVGIIAVNKKESTLTTGLRS
ncbi:multidrug transporter [Anoxybacter fermentans]|uniref:Multidrug transporter n=1 Tax=Anoxybacter fermentans TaxID=1323375 RepID=A0A3Q9HNK0_9FIRM|nr:DMT family transporter [Anoxybacter fermentans]AZR72036.1 multidrug transporter [Anoxybacter fermentans]